MTTTGLQIEKLAEGQGGTPKAGDKVTVQVVRVDMERRQVDFGLVDILERARREERRAPVRSKVKPKAELRRSQRPGRRERMMKKGSGGRRRR